jgi:outer membrane protein TolC
VVAILAIGGCQSYRARPLDLDELAQSFVDRPLHAAEALRLAGGAQTEVSHRGAAAPLRLELADAERVALLFNPTLRRLRAAAGIDAAIAAEAGRWDDPTVSLDLVRFVELADEPWVIAAMVGFTIPLSGRLDAERRLAESNWSVALAEVVEAEWQARIALRRLWSRWSASLAEAALLERHLERFEAVDRSVRQLQEAGELGRADARYFAIDRSRRAVQRVRAIGEAAALRQEILAHLGLRPDAAVALRPLDPIVIREIGPESTPSTSSIFACSDEAVGVGLDAALAAAVDRRPRLRLAALAYEASEHALDLEVRRQWPDFHIGAGGQSDEGRSGLLLGFSIPIPIFNANRQAIAAATAARSAAAIRFATTYEEVAAEIGIALVRIDHARREQRLVAGSLRPLAEAQWRDAMGLLDLGAFDAVFLVESLDSRLDADLADLAAWRTARLAESDLDAAVGPAAPEDPSATTDPPAPHSTEATS